jgi:osmotically-inducible protein OsmY
MPAGAAGAARPWEFKAEVLLRQKEIAVATLKYFRTKSTAVILSGILCACAAAQKSSTSADATASAQEDLRITYDVMQKFDQHSDLGVPNRIYVNTRDHVVYLTGTVSHSELADNAKDLARQVPGVTNVVSSISVSK